TRYIWGGSFLLPRFYAPIPRMHIVAMTESRPWTSSICCSPEHSSLPRSASCCSAIGWIGAEHLPARRNLSTELIMTLIYAMAIAIAVALAAYLCVALLKPEWFE